MYLGEGRSGDVGVDVERLSRLGVSHAHEDRELVRLDGLDDGIGVDLGNLANKAVHLGEGENERMRGWMRLFFGHC
jgi:hypothetical protein